MGDLSFTRGRPRSLEEVASRRNAGERFDVLVREFLDTFYTSSDEGRKDCVSGRPEAVAPVVDAFLAGTAEHLCVPGWTEEEGRFLAEPHFGGGFESMKAILLVESPLAFRRRMVFVSKNALSRPLEAFDRDAHARQGTPSP